MLDRSVQRFLSLLAAGDRGPRQTGIEARRRQLETLMKFGGPDIGMSRVEDRLLAGPDGALPLRIYSPPTAGHILPGLVYLHGGGLVSGSIDTHDGIARALSVGGACRVVSVDYRLSPEHRFPAALRDALRAVRHVHAHAADFAIDAGRLGICGDSAGGGLAAAACQALAPELSPRLALQLLICPILDYTPAAAARRRDLQGHLVDQDMLNEDMDHYLPPQADASDPRISPLLASDLAHLPPTYIHTAQFDPLREEAEHYADRLRGARVKVAYTCHPGMIHLFYGLGAVIPYARTALEQMGAQLRAALG